MTNKRLQCEEEARGGSATGTKGEGGKRQPYTAADGDEGAAKDGRDGDNDGDKGAAKNGRDGDKKGRASCCLHRVMRGKMGGLSIFRAKNLVGWEIFAIFAAVFYFKNMIRRVGQIFVLIALSMMLVIMGSSPALIHCNMAGTWKLSVFKMLDSQAAKMCCAPAPVVEDDCCEAAPMEEEMCCEATSENEMESCMEIVPMTIQPTITCDDNIEIPTPAEMVPLMALLGICIDNWLLQTEQPQNRNLIDDHLIVPPREVLCHHCVLLC